MAQISVIIPAYNSEKTILETIQSVQAQTFSDWEIIIIDDGSTDKTIGVVNTIQDSRIQVFSYPNAGVAAARNQGLAHATGNYIAFLDADDLWAPEKLELQLQALQESPQAGLAYSWIYYMDAAGVKLCEPDKKILAQGNVYSELLIENFIVNASNPLIKREVIEAVGLFDSELKSAEDWEYWLRIAKNWDFAVIPKPQVYYRQTSGSLSSKIDVMENTSLIVIDRIFQSVPVQMQYLKKQSLANFYRYLANQCLSRVGGVEGAKKAVKALWKSIYYYPPIILESLSRKSWTRTLFIKALAIQILSPNLALYLIDVLKK